MEDKASRRFDPKKEGFRFAGGHFLSSLQSYFTPCAHALRSAPTPSLSDRMIDFLEPLQLPTLAAG